jgi:predicted acylesterase/phospholipase RssA
MLSGIAGVRSHTASRRPLDIGRAALACVTAIMLASCAVNKRPATSVAALHTDAVTLARTDRALRDSVIERLVRRVARRGDRTLDLLFLSGGGANGAFGAGFLRGWKSRTGEPMPQFDLISGVSTGALQSPFALIGTDATLDTLATLYREATERVAPSIDWLFWLRRTGGLVNTSKFERTLTTHVTGEFSSQLRREFDIDRQIVITTADMDLGIGRMWSLGDIIGPNETSLAFTRQLLKAATAIPGIFPPVMIDGHLHADGGVVTNVMTPLSADDFGRLAVRLRERGVGDVTVRIWTIVNLWMHAPVEVVPASNRGKIDDRTTALLFYDQQLQTIQSFSWLAGAASVRNSGLRVEFRYAAIPQAMSEDKAAKKLFDRDFIRRLEQAGFDKARSANPWDSLPSAWARPPH